LAIRWTKLLFTQKLMNLEIWGGRDIGNIEWKYAASSWTYQAESLASYLN
jgi:hypothetical protein